MDINPRLLSLRLKREGIIRNQLEMMRKSSDRTLNTINETMESSFSSLRDFQDEFYVEEKREADDEDTLQIQYDLFKSFPSLEWTQNMDNCLLQQNQQDRRKKRRKMKKKTRSKMKTSSETKDGGVFDQLQILEDLSKIIKCDKNALCFEKRVALRARESQIRRKIFSLQRNGECFEL